jgi:hypothetical protein
VKRRLLRAGLFVAGALALAPPASAQFVMFSRCHGAYPCSEPFHMQYRPDPLLAGPWADVPNTAVSAHVELKGKPTIELDKPKELAADDPVAASVRYFLRKHPAPKKPKTSAPPPAPEAAAPPEPKS